eukprot:CAMPEP_0196769904 /NCGR_PEP_ID=MMETSP1104-20130614/816_1 /TAXON_ID=33652 /ORGANISM="Cafeteria sp., Strain Caron Lab Isolate" /LENGTH=466 /DNA_ID=CAMNT_0042140007 /DNA_START=12 /DNA_END=1409 /DNA_ORIENTATION=+
MTLSRASGGSEGSMLRSRTPWLQLALVLFLAVACMPLAEASDANSTSTRLRVDLKSIPPVSETFESDNAIPGLDYLGVGYDVAAGAFRLPLYTWKVSRRYARDTWLPRSFHTVYIPDGVIVRTRRRAQSQVISSVISSRTAFQEASKWDGGVGSAGVGGLTWTDEWEALMHVAESSFIKRVEHVYHLYDLALVPAEDVRYSVTGAFLSRIAALPRVCGGAWAPPRFKAFDLSQRLHTSAKARADTVTKEETAKLAKELEQDTMLSATVESVGSGGGEEEGEGGNVVEGLSESGVKPTESQKVAEASDAEARARTESMLSEADSAFDAGEEEEDEEEEERVEGVKKEEGSGVGGLGDGSEEMEADSAFDEGAGMGSDEEPPSGFLQLGEEAETKAGARARAGDRKDLQVSGTTLLEAALESIIPGLGAGGQEESEALDEGAEAPELRTSAQAQARAAAEAAGAALGD